MPSNFSFIIPGVLAGSAMPGRYASLSEDLQEATEEGITAIISLTEASLPAAHLAEAGLAYRHIPVEDFTAPTIRQLEDAARFIDEQRANNGSVMIHCHAGMGRTGTFLAAYLIKQGLSAAEAIQQIREERPGSIETREQEKVLREFEKSTKAK